MERNPTISRMLEAIREFALVGTEFLSIFTQPFFSLHYILYIYLYNTYTHTHTYTVREYRIVVVDVV